MDWHRIARGETTVRGSVSYVLLGNWIRIGLHGKMDVGPKVRVL